MAPRVHVVSLFTTHFLQVYRSLKVIIRQKNLRSGTLECYTRLKALQNGILIGILVALVECDVKETSGCVRTPTIGRLLEICPKKWGGIQGLILGIRLKLRL